MKPHRERHLVDAASICKSSSQRIGEASKPGPARVVENLDEVQLVSEQTRALQARVLADFRVWLGAYFTPPAQRSVEGCAMVFCAVLRCYGQHLYSSGQPLYKWRHLCAFYQKEKLALRPYMPACWDLATRWERLCPATHRTPTPFALAMAVMSLALSFGWARFAAVVGLAFFGAARVGEPLLARRAALLLPRDFLLPSLENCYVRVEAPKTRFRGTGRVQHFVVKRKAFVAFLDKLVGDSPPEERLFAASASTFRRRWDFLLAALGVPERSRLTPGGLRGGGAVYLYQQNVPVQDLMWRMRLRSQTTLESYLQEVAAISVLPSLPASSLRKISAAAALFDIHLQLQPSRI